MVRVTADVSNVSNTASSSDRYKYRYGYSNPRKGHGDTILKYRRSSQTPVPVKEERLPEKSPSGDDECATVEGCMQYCMDVISKKMGEMNDTIYKINNMICNRPTGTRVTRAVHDVRMNQDKTTESKIDEQKEQQQQDKKEEKLEEKEKTPSLPINKKLGSIIYHSKSGEIFIAHHSTLLHSFFDKHNTNVTTQKVVWNNKLFQTKQEWFNEMSKLSTIHADENSAILRCS